MASAAGSLVLRREDRSIVSPRCRRTVWQAARAHGVERIPSPRDDLAALGEIYGSLPRRIRRGGRTYPAAVEALDYRDLRRLLRSSDATPPSMRVRAAGEPRRPAPAPPRPRGRRRRPAANLSWAGGRGGVSLAVIVPRGIEPRHPARRRSRRLAADPSLWHVTPSGMLGPGSAGARSSRPWPRSCVRSSELILSDGTSWRHGCGVLGIGCSG